MVITTPPIAIQKRLKQNLVFESIFYVVVVELGDFHFIFFSKMYKMLFEMFKNKIGESRFLDFFQVYLQSLRLCDGTTNEVLIYSSKIKICSEWHYNHVYESSRAYFKLLFYNRFFRFIEFSFISLLLVNNYFIRNFLFISWVDSFNNYHTVSPIVVFRQRSKHKMKLLIFLIVNLLWFFGEIHLSARSLTLSTESIKYSP